MVDEKFLIKARSNILKKESLHIFMKIWKFIYNYYYLTFNLYKNSSFWILIIISIKTTSITIGKKYFFIGLE